MYIFLKPTYLLLLSLAALSAESMGHGAPASVPADSALTYQAALEKAFRNDPSLSGFEALLDAAEGQVEQAALRPNPVLGLEVENVLGTGPFRDVQGAELTLGLSQVIETSGKRGKRRELAVRQRMLLDQDRELRMAELGAAVRLAFVDVLLAQEVVGLREAQLEVTQQNRAETARLVEAARNLQVDLSRAELAVRQQQFALEQALRELESAKAQLAAFWGDTPDTDYHVSGSIEMESTVPEMSQLTGLLSGTAYLEQFEGRRAHREAALELEQAKAKPDLEIFGGGRYFNEGPGESAFVVGVNVPWPVFDKNQGNIRSARADLRRVGYEEAALRRELIRQLSAHYQTLKSAHADVLTLKNELLPSAEQTLEESQKAYELGRFTLLAVLETRATLFEIRESYLDALGRYARAQAGIEALTRPTTTQM